MSLTHESLTSGIIGAAIEVHRQHGPGLLESAYQTCLCIELELREIPFRDEIKLPVDYKGHRIDDAYKIDVWVDSKVIVEVKAVTKVHPIFEAQLLTYMKLTNTEVGLLMNFHEPVLKDGITRRVL